MYRLVNPSIDPDFDPYSTWVYPIDGESEEERMMSGEEMFENIFIRSFDRNANTRELHGGLLYKRWTSEEFEPFMKKMTSNWPRAHVFFSKLATGQAYIDKVRKKKVAWAIIDMYYDGKLHESYR